MANVDKPLRPSSWRRTTTRRSSLVTCYPEAMRDDQRGPQTTALLRTLALETVAGVLSWRHYQGLPVLPPAPDVASSHITGDEAANAWPRVSIIIPARDEAHRLPALLASLHALDYPDYEVIVVDDNSTDATAAVAKARGARVLAGQPLQPGWTGKAFACHQGALAAHGAWLLFADADTAHAPASLRAAIHYALRERLDALSLLTGQRCESAAERLLLPLAYAILFAGVSPRRTNGRPSPQEPSPPPPLPTAGQPSPPPPLPTAGEGSRGTHLVTRGSPGSAGVPPVPSLDQGRASSAASATRSQASLGLSRASNSPRGLPTAASAPLANGQYILCRAETYRQAGGHEAVRGSVIEDAALARLLVRAGAAYRLCRGESLVGVRMYGSLGDVWAGFRKNAARYVLDDPRRLPGTALYSATLGSTLPLLLRAILARRRSALALAALNYAIATALLMPWYRRFGVPSGYAALHPLGVAVLGLITADSTWRLVARRGASWKGRTYR